MTENISHILYKALKCGCATVLADGALQIDRDKLRKKFHLNFLEFTTFLLSAGFTFASQRKKSKKYVYMKHASINLAKERMWMWYLPITIPKFTMTEWVCLSAIDPTAPKDCATIMPSCLYQMSIPNSSHISLRKVDLS